MQIEFVPTRPEPPHLSSYVRLLHRIGLTALVAAVYFAAARLGFLVVAEPENLAVFWPAAGVAAGIMLGLGRPALLPCAAAIVIATLAANLINGASIPLAFVYAIANALESYVIASLLLWRANAPFVIDDTPRVLGFMAATGIGCSVSAVIAATGQALLDTSATDWFSFATTWFESDAVGVIIVAPLLLHLNSAIRRPIERVPFLEGLAVLAMLIVAGTWIFLMPGRPGGMPVVGPPVVVFPLLLWLAARTPPLFSAAASFAIATIIVVTITRGVGRFGEAGSPLDERILAAQLAMVTAAFCALILSALFEERRKAERVLMEREDQLYRALETGRVTAFEWIPDERSATRIQIGGGSPGRELPPVRVASATYFEAIHAEDRARVAATLKSLTRAHPAYSITYRYRLSGDRLVWLEETGTMQFDPQGNMTRLTGLARDVTERVHADDRQRRLIGELNHRVKNILNIISAVISRSRERHDTLDDYVRVLNGRIEAMTRTHNRLSRSGWSGVGLAELVNDEVDAHRGGNNVRVEGPAIVLKPEAAQALTLVLHELVTNAVKYGAMVPGDAGTVDITWRFVGPERQPEQLEWLWVETLAGPMSKPGPESYGTSMIRNQLRHELGADVELTFEPSGLRCRILMPISRAVDTTH